MDSNRNNPGIPFNSDVPNPCVEITARPYTYNVTHAMRHVLRDQREEDTIALKDPPTTIPVPNFVWSARGDKVRKMKRLGGKVAIVTASTQGIGFAIAERFGVEGASVVISSRKQNNVDEAVEKLRANGIDVMGVVCHVSNAQHRKNLVEKTIEKYGKIDIIVSNAAANPTTDSILHTEESVLDKLWEVNVKASILFVKAAAPYLRKGSAVILISSIGGFHPQQSMAMYGVTKTALFGLTKALAAEMGPDTRVNCVAPGFVPTRFADFLTRNEEIRKSIEEKTILSRLGTADDMAAAAAFLVSDDASYITGETLVVAGGMPSRL